MAEVIRGRFAPSPSGRLHLGNIMSSLLAWLDVRSRCGTVVFRLEDLYPERSWDEYARLMAGRATLTWKLCAVASIPRSC